MRRTAPVGRAILAIGLLGAVCGEPVRAEGPAAAAVGTTPLRHAVTIAADRSFVAQPALADLGRRIFHDARLSEPAGVSCATCHDPAHGFAGGRVANRGIAEGSVHGRFGVRNVPALRYARYAPPLYFFSDEPDDDPTPQPRGGLLHDGRVDRFASVPRIPLLDKREMNNRDVAAVAKKLRHADYAADIRGLFGPKALATPDRAIKALGEALEAYLQSDALSPFTSRYDAYIAGRGELTPIETKGMRLFRDPLKGNCGGCHDFNPDSSNPRRSMFTDYGYDAVAAPRNTALRNAAGARTVDLGLCTTAAMKHWPDPAQWCGYFRTPSLRNVAVRERFMHNGVFKDLKTVVEFYATRSTDPKRWYPSGVPFDDLPARYRRNVNVIVSPWNRKAGARPGLDAAEIDAVVAFLDTLTDRDLAHRPTQLAVSATGR